MKTVADKNLENWGDMEDDLQEVADDVVVLPPPKTSVDENGVRTTIAYVSEKSMVDGKEVIKYFRTVRKSRNVTLKKKRSKAAIARAGKLSKFGALAGKSQGPEKGITDHLFDEIYFEFEHEKGKKVEEKEVKTQSKSIISCNVCGGAHWTNKCPNRALLADKMDSGRTDLKSGIQDSGRSKSYVPPNKRAGASSGDRGGPHDDNDPTIRISNIPENATQDDMNQLLRPFHINKLRLAKKNYEPYGNRGFAFVTFNSIKDAYVAMMKLTGHKYGHMILKAEWSDNYKKNHPKGVPITEEMKKAAQEPVRKSYSFRSGGGGWRGRGGGGYRDRDRGDSGYRGGGGRFGGGGGGYSGSRSGGYSGGRGGGYRDSR